ncbi:hypothetical protein WA171_001471 [Blastocystis sp. BT1]
MLYYAGIVREPGNVDDGNTVTDFLQEERERGITIQSAAISFPWKSSIVNLIDTPGHVDFSIEVERCLRVLDGGIAVLDGVAGVEAQTETVWEQANRYRLPRLLYINKMDRIGADFDRVTVSVKERLGVSCLKLQYPHFVDERFCGMIDVIHHNYIRFAENDEGDFTEETLPSELVSKADSLRDELIEQLAEVDNSYSDLYLEGKTSQMQDPSQLTAAVRRVLLNEAKNHRFDQVPVFCGSSLKNKGVQQLLDAVDALLPSPLDVALPDIFYYVNKELLSIPFEDALHGKASPSLSRYLKKKPLIMYAFKLQYTTQGMIVFARVYQGELKTKGTVYNTRTKKTEKVLRIMQISADHTDSLDAVRTGQIVALHGLTSVQTGDTLVTPKDAPSFLLEPIRPSAPVFTVNVEAENQVQLTKLEKVLSVLSKEDPSLQVQNDEESAQLLLSGMGELHLEVLQQRLKREFGLEAFYSKMRVNYRETVGEESILTGEYDRTVNNRSYHVKVGVEVSPSVKDDNEIIVDDNKFNTTTRLTDEMVHILREGIHSCLSRGPILGYSMHNVRVSMKPELCLWEPQTPSIVVQAALITCLSSGLREHRNILLEPVMKYEANINTESLGNVVSDLTSKRRGVIKEIGSNVSQVCPKSIIHAEVPLAEMIGYSSIIRILTGGENSFSLSFDKYVEVPDDVVESIKKME